MKLKKLAALSLVVIMTASVFAGCGKTETETESSAATSQETEKAESTTEKTEQSEETTAEESKEITFPLAETMEFTGLSIMCNTWNMADNMAWNAALDRANIHIELTEFPAAEMKEKGNLLMSSGDYPEVLYKCGALDLNSYGMEGLLIPLEDLIREYMPTLTSILDERNGWHDIMAADGHVYSLPHIQPSYLTGGGDGCWWINKQWMDNLGLEEPKSMEELYDVLKAFKEEDANGNGDPDDEIPVTFAASPNWFLPYQGDALHYGNYYCAIVDGEMVYYPTTEGFKENYLAFLTKMYEEGILDPNGFTQTTDQMKAVGQSAEVYGMMFASSATYVPEGKSVDYISLKPFDESTYALSTGIGTGGLAITDKCENPEVIMAWADYFYTEEGGILARMGIEGVSYVMNEDGTYTNINESDQFESRIYQCTLMGAAQLPVLIPDLYYNASPVDSPEQAHYEQQRFGPEGVFSMGVVVPTLKFTEEENEIMSTLNTDIKAYVESYSAEVISGLVSLDATWDDFQNTLKDMGVEELESIYKAAYERALAAQ